MVLLECWVLISPLPWKSRRSKAKFPCWIHLFFFFLNLIFYEERRNFWEGLGWREQPRLPIRANVEVILRSNLRGSVHPKSDQGPKILSPEPRRSLEWHRRVPSSISSWKKLTENLFREATNLLMELFASWGKRERKGSSA